MKKKAQVEMIGLIVIVILVIIGLLIFTVYKINNPSRNLQKKYMNKEIATNMLIAMTNTNVEECHDITLASLITDCARTYHSITCYDYTSCEIANKTIYDILNKTLIDWGIGFNLTIEDTDITFVMYGCDSTARDKVQSFQILPLNPGQIEMTLDICNE